MRRHALLAVALVLPMLSADLSAQQARSQAPRAGELAPRRQQLEARLNQRLWRITKNRIGLSDDQMTKLAQGSRPFETQRRELARQERAERMALRREVLAGAGADQQRIATSLDRVLELQRRRAELQIDEQRALAAFMTPLQRAKYAALQEQLRRRAEQLRGQRVGTPRDDALDSLR